MSNPLLVDGRNLYEPGEMARLGFVYHSIGRPDAASIEPADHHNEVVVQRVALNGRQPAAQLARSA
jgi:UDPglucose 6-dehydrogenase